MSQRNWLWASGFHQEDAGWIIYGLEVGTSKRMLYPFLATKDPESRPHPSPPLGWGVGGVFDVFPSFLLCECKVKQV